MSSRIKTVHGDLLDAFDSPIKADVIAHQTNLKTSRPAGVAKALFDKFRWSNIYSRTKEERCKPGEASACFDPDTTRVIIGLNGQIGPGKPKRGDTRSDRLGYFETAFIAMLQWMKEGTVAIPYNIGCGLAGGNWTDYKDIIKRVVSEYPSIKVVIVKLPGL